MPQEPKRCIASEYDEYLLDPLSLQLRLRIIYHQQTRLLPPTTWWRQSVSYWCWPYCTSIVERRTANSTSFHSKPLNVVVLHGMTSACPEISPLFSMRISSTWTNDSKTNSTHNIDWPRRRLMFCLLLLYTRRRPVLQVNHSTAYYRFKLDFAVWEWLLLLPFPPILMESFPFPVQWLIPIIASWYL